MRHMFGKAGCLAQIVLTSDIKEIQTKENKMKKKFTKNQIVESIKYWKKQLDIMNNKKINESMSYNGNIFHLIDEIQGQLQAINTDIDDLHNNVNSSNPDIVRIREIAESLANGYKELAAFFDM